MPPEPALDGHRLVIGGQAVVVASALQVGTPSARRRNLDLVLDAVMMRKSDCVKLGIAAAERTLMAGVAPDNWFDGHVEKLKRLRSAAYGRRTPGNEHFAPSCVGPRRN